MLHVREGDEAIGLIGEILSQLNARAVDIQTGDMSDETWLAGQARADCRSAPAAAH